MMVFPSLSDLSDEQLDVYNFNKNTPLLITGGPGSGKTIMALWRAHNLILSDEKVSLVMFNKTLLSYTEPYFEKINQEADAQIKNGSVLTVNSFMTSSYRRVTGKNLGRHIDYDVLLHWAKKSSDEDLASFFGSFFVIDEGQDFSPSFYLFMGEAWRRLEGRFCPTVLADENQILNEHDNSSIDDIKKNLGLIAASLGNFGEKELTRNYRNTNEISVLANFFYDDTVTNPPSPPTLTSGIIPKYFNFKDNKEAAKRIVNYSNDHPTERVGVLMSPLRGSQIAQNMATAIRDEQGLEGKLYYYTSDPAKYAVAGVRNPDFHQKGSVTVLTRQSSKGLEFDSVFVMNLESLETDERLDESKRNLYVLSTRPKKQLYLCSTGITKHELPNIMQESFFRKAIEEKAINMMDNNHNLSRQVKNKQDLNKTYLEKENINSKGELIIEKSKNIDPEKPKLLFKKTEGNGVEDLWKLISSLTDDGEPIVNVVLIGKKTSSYIQKMGSKINEHSKNFITGLQIGNTFVNRDGKTINVLEADSLTNEVIVPMIVANLEDVSSEITSQKSLKRIIDCTSYKSFFLLCKGMTEDQSKGLEMLKNTGDLKII